MQIQLDEKDANIRRVDFYGSVEEGIVVELVNKEGVTYYSKQLSDKERTYLINKLMGESNASRHNSNLKSFLYTKRDGNEGIIEDVNMHQALTSLGTLMGLDVIKIEEF